MSAIGVQVYTKLKQVNFITLSMQHHSLYLEKQMQIKDIQEDTR